MKIIPMDIVRKTFSRKVMGFSPEEVMEFLSLIAAEMENIIRERNNLRDSLREKEMSVVEFRQREEVLKNTISTANMMSEKMKTDAEREARLIVNDANQQADIITRDARDSLKKIYAEVSELKRIRLQYENNLRALVESHLTMMEQGQKIMPDPELEGLDFQGDTNTTAPTDNTTHEAELNQVQANVSQAIKEKVEHIEL